MSFQTFDKEQKFIEKGDQKRLYKNYNILSFWENVIITSTLFVSDCMYLKFSNGKFLILNSCYRYLNGFTMV